uniref:Ig-like domain-containing protein n=1 Tax=Sander lucioperca TaxID=283035 RepID=A0A8D0AZ03_SANLU
MSANYVHISAGLCYGAGVLTVDLLSEVAGQSVTFTTSVKPAAEPFMALTWSFNGTTNVITSTSVDVVGPGYENRIILDKSTGSLVLRNLTEKDSGEYDLIIIPHGAGQIQGTAKLDVLTKVSKPTMACPTENLIEGKTSLNLTCDADSFKSRVWMKDGKPLVSGDGFSFHDGNRVLSISPVNRRDTGEFLCNVSNDFSFDTAKCRLEVYYGPDRPIIVQTPIGAELEENGPENINLTLSPSQEYCSAVSRPAAQFQWFLNGDLLSDTGPDLRMMNIQMSQSGNYSCQAFNNKTMKNQTSQTAAIAVVKCKLERMTSYFGPEKTNLKRSPSQEYFKEGSNIDLMCSAVSRPAAQFHWFLNGDLLSDTGPELRLMNIQMSQSGNYSCQAFNSKTLRYDTSQPAAVFVLSKLEYV